MSGNTAGRSLDRHSASSTVVPGRHRVFGALLLVAALLSLVTWVQMWNPGWVIGNGRLRDFLGYHFDEPILGVSTLAAAGVAASVTVAGVRNLSSRRRQPAWALPAVALASLVLLMVGTFSMSYSVALLAPLAAVVFVAAAGIARLTDKPADSTTAGSSGPVTAAFAASSNDGSHALPAPAGEAPGVGFVVAMSILFGPFGAFAARSRSQQAARLGVPGHRYWSAFWVAWLVSWVVGVLVTLLLYAALIALFLAAA